MDKESQISPRKVQKILVIGSTGHPREVQCFKWEEIGKVPNIADFNGVIIDMTSLPVEVVLNKLIKSESKYFTANYFRKLFLSGGRIFVIYASIYPLFYFPSPQEQRIMFDYWHIWSPIKPHIEEEKGETVKAIAEPYKRYFSAVKSWGFTFKSFSYDDGSTKYLIETENDRGCFYLQILAKNRYDAILAAKIVFRDKNGEFCFLPPPTEVSSKEGINILLEDIFGIKIAEQAEPDWLSEIKIPGEEEMDADVQKALNKIEEENQKIVELKKKKKEITKFKKLLYAKSHELEEIVLLAFQEFGAEVIYPKEKNKEDGWIVTKYGKGVLEIKKKGKSANKDDVRQLNEWVGYCLERGEECKGILVVNHYGDLPLKDRKEPFPNNVKEYAKKARKISFCLLTTVELFKAYCAFKKGEIDGDTIFKRIFEAKGECKLLEKKVRRG